MRQNLRASDVVLVHVRQKPAFYAQIKNIEPDVKKGWYRVSLRSPFGDLQWILEDVHVFLAQTWTFEGIIYRMQRIGRRREGSGIGVKAVPLRRVK
jgi:hypothetical protein